MFSFCNIDWSASRKRINRYHPLAHGSSQSEWSLWFSEFHCIGSNVSPFISNFIVLDLLFVLVNLDERLSILFIYFLKDILINSWAFYTMVFGHTCSHAHSFLGSHTFSQIHPPSIPFKLCDLLKRKVKHRIQIYLLYTLQCRVSHWSVVNLLWATLSKKTDSPSPRSFH